MLMLIRILVASRLMLLDYSLENMLPFPSELIEMLLFC